ncbi:MAG: EamA family transporter [Bacteroidia bacterium]
MIRNERSRAYLLLHTAIVLYGFTGILGRLIHLEGIVLVWYRMAITFVSLCMFPGLIRKALSLPRKTILKITGLGVLLSIHWVTFFDGIRFSNVSITLSCLASTAFFTSIFEPLVFKRRIQIRELLLGAIVIVGFVFMFQATEGKFLFGMAISIVSAIIVAGVGVGNKVLVAQENPLTITILEFAGGVLGLTIMLPVYLFFLPETVLIPRPVDIFYLLVLALLCTTLAYNLNLYAIRHISAYTSALSINLEPIYAMIMAWLIFREDKELSPGFYAGAAIILLSVFLNGWFEYQLSSSRRKLV